MYDKIHFSKNFKPHLAIVCYCNRKADHIFFSDDVQILVKLLFLGYKLDVIS